MSFIKRLIEEQEEQNNVAVRIAVEAGALKRCELHGIVYDPLGGDMEGAYRLGNYKFSKGELPVFHDRREMTDAIQNAVNEAGMDCPYCANNREED